MFRKILRSLFAYAFIICLSCPVLAQNPVIQGSGKLVQKKFELAGFSQLDIRGLNGTIIVEAGKPFSVEVMADDNVLELIKVDKAGNSLLLAISRVNGEQPYFENIQLTIRISMPRLDSVLSSGNATLQISGVDNKVFTVEAKGNGLLQLAGRTGELRLMREGNGDTDAAALLASSAWISKSGNGDITFYASGTFNVQMEGNGDIRNAGKGIAANVIQKGNGRIVDAASQKL
jgi:hypothetical protein